MPPVIERDESVEQLAWNARAGCGDSFERLVLALQDRLFTFLFQILGNESDAEDVAQETFLKAYRNLHSFDGRARFTTWLYAIAKNTALNHVRRRRLADPIDQHSDRLPAPAESAASDDVQAVWTLARTLKPRLYEVLWLHYAEGFSMNEIATVTRTNAISVRVALHRARVALRKKFDRDLSPITCRGLR